ncbi:MAG: hypothetical protein V2A70_07010, partial [Candidatus Omnitrophota bacterium]
ADVSEERVKWIQDWMNNYPRKILGYKTANEWQRNACRVTIDLKAYFCRTMSYNSRIKFSMIKKHGCCGG